MDKLWRKQDWSKKTIYQFWIQERNDHGLDKSDTGEYRKQAQ